MNFIDYLLGVPEAMQQAKSTQADLRQALLDRGYDLNTLPPMWKEILETKW